MDEILRSYMPPMLTGSKLDEALRIKPEYSESIRNATEAETFDRVAGYLQRIYPHGHEPRDLFQAVSGTAQVYEQEAVADGNPTVQRKPENH